MKLFIKIFIVLISVIIGLYLGGRYGIYLLENDKVDLGPSAGNLIYPLFIIIISIVGGILSGLTIAIFFILSKFVKRNKIKDSRII